MIRTSPPLREIAEPDFRELCEAVVADMERLRVPGVALGLLHRGSQHVAGFGVTSLDHPLEVDGDTLFQTGSITKTFTATAAMRLVESGGLDLDAPVRAYLPDLRLASEETASRVTMRHLLTHMGGWQGDHFDDLGPGDDALARYVADMAHLPQLTPLGSVWSYNNSGFCLAGRVMEVVTGMSFEAVVKELVLDPVGMPMSFFFANDMMTHGFAVGHLTVDGHPQVARPWPIGRTSHPAGGIAASVRDLLTYARFQKGDGTTDRGERLLSAESMALMKTPQVQVADEIDAIGLSWWLKSLDGTDLALHLGQSNGQYALLSIAPAEEFAIAVLTNSDRGGRLMADATTRAFSRYLGLRDPEPRPLDMPREALEQYVGRYTTVLSEVDLTLGDGGLVAKTTSKGGFPNRDSPPRPSPPPSRLTFYDVDRVFVSAGPAKGARGEFLRDPDGNIRWYRTGLRINARQGG